MIQGGGVDRKEGGRETGRGNGEGAMGGGDWDGEMGETEMGDGEEEGKMEKSWQGPGVGRKGGGRRVDKKEWGGEGETGLGQ